MKEGIPMLYDSIIIGSGPAGLEAALTLKNRNKNFLILGEKKLSNKINKAHTINNYLGLPSISGEDLQKAFLDHLSKANIEITEERVTGVYKTKDYFSILTSKNNTYTSLSIIISTGVNFGKPYIGEEEFLGRGVSYCATCDAMFYKHKVTAVISSNPEFIKEAQFLKEYADKVYYIPTYENDDNVPSSLELIRDTPIKITGEIRANKLILQDQELDVDGIFILRDALSPKTLIPGIKLDGTHIEVNRKMETSIKGIFACGDITGLPYQYIKSAGEGNIAALSCINYLATLNKK